MHQSLRETLVWGTLGAMSYVLGGLLLFLAVVPVTTGDGLDVGALTPIGAVLLLAGLGCFTLGAFCVRKGNPRRRRSSPPLPERFQKGVESRDESGDELRKRDLVDQGGLPPRGADDAGPLSSPDPSTVRCPNCGARNERGYTFCSHCSGRLSG